jgi:hypothetical protein
MDSTVSVREPFKEFSVYFKIRLSSTTDILRRMMKLQCYHHHLNTGLKSACLKFTTTKVRLNACQIYVSAKSTTEPPTDLATR